MARIVLNTFGSFGDLHPYLAVAIGLKQRGHRPVIATAEIYRKKIEAEAVDFAPVRPNIGEMAGNAKVLSQIWHPRRGTEFLIRDYIMPTVEQSFEDLLPACRDADLLLTHAAAYAGPIVAEVLKLPWLSVALQPMAFLSAYDPPVLPPAKWLAHFEVLGPRFVGAILTAAKRSTRSWAEPVAALRRRLGLPRADKNPMFEGQFSPFGTLAWFSEHYAKPQPDWPPRTQITGFPFYDRLGHGLEHLHDLSTAGGRTLDQFLNERAASVLFTLGSSAVMHPGTFYRESFEAARRLGIRAILLAGALPRETFPQPLPDSIFIASYAPYSEVMPRCLVSVHQGGIGTTAQALRSGKPMIVVPWAHDQPDNAARVRKLGCGRSIPRNQYTADRAVPELEKLLQNRKAYERADAIGRAIAHENGVENACSAIENCLDSLRSGL